MARGQGVNPFGIPTNAQPMDEKGGTVTIPWRLFFTRLAQSVANLIVSAVPGAPNTSIQYNKSGVFGGDANLTWDKDRHAEEVQSITGESVLWLKPSLAMTPWDDPGYAEINFGHHVVGGNYIPTDPNPALIWWDTNGWHVEIYNGQTVPNPMTFVYVVGLAVTGGDRLVTAQGFGLGSGAVQGMGIGATRNDAGTGAASTLFGQLKDGRYFVFWVDNTGAPRYNIGATLDAIRPTENGSVSDTSGTLFGSGSGTVTNNYTQLFTRRGDDGRIGTPGLPGPQGAAGSTGATGPAGANGIIITRRSDEGRNGMPGLPGVDGAAGANGATGPAGAAGVVISRRPDEGRSGMPGPQGPVGATGSAGSGALLGVQTITATGSGTYTPTGGTTSVVIELLGAGGGGGGVASAGAVQTNLATGGGGGAYVRVRLTTAFSGASYSVGAKGTGGASGNNNGNDGGNTTFTATGGGTVYTAGGGIKGQFRGSFATPISAIGATDGGAGGTPTNGDLQVSGQPAGNAVGINSNVGWSGTGGNSFYGAGAPSVTNGAAASTAGINATGKGAGGGGAYSSNAGGSQAGGNGSDGILIIWEYA